MSEDVRREPGRALSTAELITLGRDREAVIAAINGPAWSNDTKGGRMNGAEQLGEIIPMLEEIVAKISPAQLDAPTPCANFAVSGVLEHMIGGAIMFAPAFRGKPTPTADVSGRGDTFERWRAAMTDLLDAVRSPGALDRVVATPFGELQGSAFAQYVAFDGVIHGWDLSTATGQPYDPRPELVSEIDEFIRGLITPEMRDGDTFAAETAPPADATPLLRLVAFSGRPVPTEGDIR